MSFPVGGRSRLGVVMENLCIHQIFEDDVVCKRSLYLKVQYRAVARNSSQITMNFATFARDLLLNCLKKMTEPYRSKFLPFSFYLEN